MRVWSQTAFTTQALRQHGCGAAVAIQALVEMSDGRWRPSGRGGTMSAHVRVQRSGVTDAEFRTRGLTSTELYRSLDAVAADDVRMALRVKQYRGVDVRKVLLPRIDAIGGCAAVAVSYGTVQDAGLGVGSYRLGHWVLVSDPDHGSVAVADPLRTRVVRWDIGVLVEAMGRFGRHPWGDGRGEAILVWPWRTWREAYADCRAAA